MEKFLKMLNNTKPVASTALSYYQQNIWKTTLEEYLGKFVIYVSTLKKETPKLVTVKEINEHTVLLEETLYTKDSLVRGTIPISVNYSAFICGDVKVVVFNE